LKSYEFVDPQRIFLFGHSAGGWVAPLVASSESVRGIVVYGTVVRPFAEYLVDNYRRSRRMRDQADPVKVEESVRQMMQFLHYLLVENGSPAEVVARHPELATARKFLFPFDDRHFYDLRSLRYLQELSAKNVAQAWARQDAPVLAMYGVYDIRTTAMDHEYIAEIVNSRHAGHGTWIQIPRMDHGFALHPSLREAVAQEFKGPFGDQVVLESVNWMYALGTKPPM
jgi:pimeloyl-ACP methyl ester carboxylesterase